MFDYNNRSHREALYRGFIRKARGIVAMTFTVHELSVTDDSLAYTILEKGSVTRIFVNPFHPIVTAIRADLRKESMENEEIDLHLAQFLTGLLTHEMLHTVYTDPAALMEAMKVHRVPEKHKNVYASLNNILEDCCIEERGNVLLEGLDILNALHYTIFQVWRQTDPVRLTDSVYSQYFNALVQYTDMGMIRGSLTGEAEEMILKAIPIIYDAISRPPTARAESAWQLYKLIRPYLKAEDESSARENTRNQTRGQNENADQDEFDENRLKGLDQKRNPGNQSDGSDSSSSEGDSSQSGGQDGGASEDGTSGSSGKDSDEDTDARQSGSGCQDGESSDNSGSQSDSQDGSASEDGTSVSSGKDSDEDTDARQPGSGCQDGESSDNSGSQSDSQDGDASEEGTSARSRKRTGKRSDSSQSGSERADDTSEIPSLTPDEPEPTEDNSRPGFSDASDAMNGHNKNEAHTLPVTPEYEEGPSSYKELRKSFEKGISELADKLTAVVREAPVFDLHQHADSCLDIHAVSRIYGDQVKCENITVTGATPEVMEVYNQIKAMNRPAIHLLSRQLQNLTRSPESLEHAKRGSLNLARCARMNESPRIFDRYTHSDRLDSAVCIMLDNSGSMYGERIEAARSAAICIAEAMAVANLPLKVITFTEQGGTVRHRHYVNYRNRASDRAALASIDAECSNFDGFSIRYGVQDLLKQRARNNLLIVISDGQPACSFYSGYATRSGINDTAEAVKTGKKLCKIIGIGIGADLDILKGIYQETFVSMTNLSQLMTSLGKMIVKEVRSW